MREKKVKLLSIIHLEVLIVYYSLDSVLFMLPHALMISLFLILKLIKGIKESMIDS